MSYIITYYLPSGLFVVVSWISFLIPPDIVPGTCGLECILNQNFRFWCNCGVLLRVAVLGKECYVFEPGTESQNSWQKLCIFNLPNDCFEQTTCWVPCADGIKLQFLCSVRFWTSLVRNCLNYPEISTRINWIIMLDDGGWYPISEKSNVVFNLSKYWLIFQNLVIKLFYIHIGNFLKMTLCSNLSNFHNKTSDQIFLCYILSSNKKIKVIGKNGDKRATYHKKNRG